MPGSSHEKDGWRSLPSGTRGWQASHRIGSGSGRLSVRSRRAIAGLLALGCIAGIFWLIILWRVGQPVPVHILAYGISVYDQGVIPPNETGRADASAFLALEDLNSKYSKRFIVEDLENKLGGGELQKSLVGDYSKENLVVLFSMHGRVSGNSHENLVAQFYGIHANGVNDVEPDSESMIPIPDVLEKLRQSQAKNILLLIDVGHLQSNWELGLLANDFVDQLLRHLENKPLPNLCVLCSAGPYESSWVDSGDTAVSSSSSIANSAKEKETDKSTAAKMSVFAHFVLEGLKGKADGWGVKASNRKSPSGDQFVATDHPTNNSIDSDELYAYVRHHVAQAVEKRQPSATQTILKLGAAPRFEIAPVVRPSKSNQSPAEALANEDAGDDATQNPPVATTTKAKPEAGKTDPAQAGAPASKIDPKIFKSLEFVLVTQPNDPKVLEAVGTLKKTLQEGDEPTKNAKQQELVQWLIQQAAADSAGKIAFNLRPHLLAEIEPSNRTPDLEFLTLFLEAERPSAGAGDAWPSTRFQRAIAHRRQVAEEVPKSADWPPSVQKDFVTVLKTLIAAERWLLAPTNDVTLKHQMADLWFEKTQLTLSKFRERQAQFTAARALLTRLPKAIPTYSAQLADRTERELIDADWNKLNVVRTWLTKSSDPSASTVPAEVQNSLSDPNRDLLLLMRTATSLKRMLGNRADFDEERFKFLVPRVETLWTQVQQQRAHLDGDRRVANTNSQLAGIWQGFWAIETLRFQDVPHDTMSLLESRWSEFVEAGANNSGSITQDLVRLERVRLGDAIREAWAKMRQDQRKLEGAAKSEAIKSTEVPELWSELTHLQSPRGALLHFSQSEVASTVEQGEFVIGTTRGDELKFGAGQFHVELPRVEAPAPAVRELRFFTSDNISITKKGIRGTRFKLDPQETRADFTARFLKKSIQQESMLVTLVTSVEGETDWEFPVEIRKVRVNPPFDPSLWSVVFKTDKGQPVQPIERVQTKSGSKLFLVPFGEVSLTPYLKGPASNGEPIAIESVKAFGQTRTGQEALIAEIKDLSLGSAGETLLKFEKPMAPAPAAPAAAAAGTPAPVAEAPRDDISRGLRFAIKPKGLAEISHAVAVKFYSEKAFIEQPIPRFHFSEREIEIPIERKAWPPETDPLLGVDISVTLQQGPEYSHLIIPGTSTADRKPLYLRFKLSEKALTIAGSLTFSITVAGLPHAYRWELSPSTRAQPRLINGATGKSSIRIAAPRSGTAYLRNKEGKLNVFLDPRDEKPTLVDRVDVRIEVDSPEMDQGEDSQVPWRLNYELSSNGKPSSGSEGPGDITASLRKFADLSLKAGAWKIATKAADYETSLPSEGLNGKYRLKAELLPPGATRPVEYSTSFVIDDTPPAEPEFVKLAPVYPSDRDMKFKVDVDDLESGIYQVAVGVDVDGNLKLDDKEKILATAERSGESGHYSVTIPKNRLPAKDSFRLVAEATNGTRLLNSTAVSDFVQFKPPELPKAATKGTLRVKIDRNGAAYTWTLKGPTPKTEDLPYLTSSHDFPDLEPGDYEVEISGLYKGSSKKKVEAGKLVEVFLNLK
jgi:hypothetical protein